MALSKRKNILIALVLVAAAATVAVTFNRPESGSPAQTTDDAYVQADITFISPQVSGIIDSVQVKDNQHVDKGMLLATIDDRDFVVAVDAARARVAKVKAAIAGTESKILLQDSLIRQAQAVLQADEAQLSLAQANDKRYRNLAAEGSGTRQSAQQAAAQLGVQSATVLKSQASLEASNRQKTILHDERDQELAQLSEANAALANAELRLSWTKIYAPVNGAIGLKSLREGAYVNTGASLLAIVPIGQLYITANYRETQLQHIKTGQPVDITVDAFPGVVLKGKVDSLGPASGASYSSIPPHNATGNFTKIIQRLPLKIRIDPEQDIATLLRVGMSVQPTVYTR